ncbi:MAG: OmpA family protein [Ruminobacter sp.]|uniref:OmpA family protein n=1 Tax=Ruminobacter sp. TaxID=2774296 RepID=UPI001B6D88CB|nr:OmpA family protein [Ruminobacter sp.]MBP3749083.1 OmpA family protein [Ruminobacter sp.]
MKKSLLAVAVLGAFIGGNAFAAEGNTGYIGVKGGWSHVMGHQSRWADTADRKTSNDFDAGLYAGYNFTDFLGIEAGYDYLGKFANKGYNDSKNIGDYYVHGAEAAIVPSYPITKDSDVFVKLGALFATVKDDAYGKNAFHTSPLVGAGTRIGLGDDFTLRLEYLYAHKIMDSVSKFGYAPNLQNVNLGLEWKFGGAAPAPVPAPAPAPKAPENVVINETISLDASTLFDFGSSSLSANGKNRIATETQKIRENDLKDVSIRVEGHTDRIGSEAANMKLSKKRAETVVEEFIANGVDQSAISAEGYGESRPVTGTECDNIKNRKKLIECLAPDRRVEVKFSGVKQVIETK